MRGTTKPCCIATALLGAATFAGAQNIITTVAGNGTAGYSGDGGPAINAQFRELMGLAADAAGNIYAADHWNHRVRKITPTGIVTTVAGTGEPGFSGDGGPATAAQLQFPSAMVVDSSGSLYIADTYNSRIRKVDLTGVISTIAGNGTRAYPAEGGLATENPLGTPEGMALDSAGNLYFADESNHGIWKVTPDGILIRVAGGNGAGYSGDGGPARDAQLSAAWDVKVNNAGTLYISDNWNHRIRKVTTDGVITTIAGDGNLGYAGDNGLAASARLAYPGALDLDGGGNLYIGDGWNSRVRKITPGGIVTTVAGNGTYGFSGDGGPATSASMTYPTGVAVGAGRLYISDIYNWRIRMVSLTPPVTLGPAKLWVGLKNSDDQGTQFDVRVELYKNQTTVLSAGETLCTTGVTRNANLAKQVEVPFGPVEQETLIPGDQLSLRVLTRIGTNPDGTKCSGPGGSHNNAVGLRLYYDATNRSSGFGAEINNGTLNGFYLHTSGTNFFDTAAPVGATAKYKDSTGLNFTGGNAWKAISDWAMIVP